MLSCLLLFLCVIGVWGQVAIRYRELDINTAVDRQNIIVLTGVTVYRDDLVVLDTYAGVITVNTDTLEVENVLFDGINLTHVYATVDSETGILALCTNRKGRCQYMNVSTLSVLGFGDGLILEGEQGEEVDQGVLILIANTNTNVTSLFTVSGNAVTIGQTGANPRYPIRTAQLGSTLSIDARLLGVSLNVNFNRKYIAMIRTEGYVYIVSDDGGDEIRVTRICESDSLNINAFHSLYQTILTPCNAAPAPNVLDARLVELSNEKYLVVTYEDRNTILVCAYTLSSINQAMRDIYVSCVVNRTGMIPNEQLFGSNPSLQCSLYTDPNVPSNNTECNLWIIDGQTETDRVFLEAAGVSGGIQLINTNVSGNALVSVTMIEDSGNSYYYLYFIQNNIIQKYLLNGLSLVTPPLETLTLSETITAVDKDQSGSNLYAITNSMLYSIPLDDCRRHPSCVPCVQDSDPLCGWCTAESVCSRRSLCSNYNLTNRWIGNDVTVCLSVSAVSPNSSNINVNTNVTLYASNLPQLAPNENYECVFSSGISIYRTQITAVNGNMSLVRGPVIGIANITCQVPSGVTPSTVSDTREYNISLSTNILSVTIGDIFLYTIVDCTYNNICITCIQSTAICGWCLYNSMCVPAVDSCVMQEWVQPTASETLCPRVDSSFNRTTLQVAALESINITLQGSNLPAPTAVYNYTCVLSVVEESTGPRGVQGAPGVWRNTSGTGSEIDCVVQGDRFTEEGMGAVQLVWGPNMHPISQGTLEFGVFICGNQLDCISCLGNSACNWCTLDNRTGECSSVCDSNLNMFTPSNTCPPPVITGFTPISTAVGGSVVLEVTGFNMAVKGRDTSVMIGEIECTVSIVTNISVTCQLQASNQISSDRLNLTVAGISVESMDSFNTTEPEITGIFPNFTPQFGSSNITLTGRNLLVGSNRQVRLGGVDCTIEETTSNDTADTIVCATGKFSSVTAPLMSITIDNVETTYSDEQVNVLADPQVINVFLTGTNTPLRGTIVSGGLDYTLSGRNLGATLSQILVFMNGDNEISRSVCVSPAEPTADLLLCPGTPFTGITPDNTGTDVRFELIMDAVPNVTRIYFQVFEFKLYTKPKLVNSSIMIDEGDEEIEIEIQNIGRIPPNAFTVKQASTNRTACSSIQITTDMITCFPETEITTTTNTSVELEIEIGLNDNRYVLRQTLEIVAESPVVSFLKNNMAPLIGIAVVILLCVCLLFLFLCVCCCCLGRSKRTTRIKKEEAEHLLAEMEDIENDLADRCRKGFTELNTQMGLDEGTLIVGAIPIHSFKTFAMRILFPGLQDHPVLHPVEKPRSMDTAVFGQGLHKFEQLLHDKEFFIVLIRSMEENRNFSVRDRCNVASLVTIALFGSMPYLTEVLFELLEELINRNVTRNTSKLLLRRTESVAEKLLADWLAFNLFSHLQGSPSVAMYKLFLGIKGHLESGPVDVLNGNAGHSLSEEKLMRQEVEHTKIEVEAEAADGTRHCCKLLDCDTITQTKIKLMDTLYKGIGFSQRPKLEDVEVELRSQGGGRLQLRDNDMTNEGDEEWRKINTLAHYHINGGMVLSIVQRKQKPNPGQVWDYPGTSIYDFGHTQSLSRLLSLDEESSKVYHLQKSEQIEDYQEQTKTTLRRRQYGSEIFLPKLVATKRILQTYIDQLVDEIFPEVQHRGVPKAIKVLYDFLDSQGTLYGIEDPDVLHTWKNNSVPLRFWVNILKNPEFLLDVAKSASLDAALSVISQAFIDGCSPGQSFITRDSPTNKLLYHKEVQSYKGKVKRYYEGIRNAPPVERNSLTFNTTDFLEEGQHNVFYVESAVYGLFSYAQSYQEAIKTRLSNENLDNLQQTFEEVCLDIAENLYMV